NLSGVLKNSKGEAIPSASVMVKNADNKIVNFKNSDANGKFSLTIPIEYDRKSLSLEINHLGYKKINASLAPEKNHYEIILEEQAINLAEVQVKSRPHLRSIGDTLTYNVESFAKEEDRSIGDV